MGGVPGGEKGSRVVLVGVWELKGAHGGMLETVEGFLVCVGRCSRGGR